MRAWRLSESDRKKAGGLSLPGGTAAPVYSGPIKTSQSSRREGRKAATGRGGGPLGVEEMRSDIGNKPMIGKECSCG